MERCDGCGRFMNLADGYYSWIRYGYSYETEPADPDYMHRECYENQDFEHKELISKNSWIKPYYSEKAEFLKETP